MFEQILQQIRSLNRQVLTALERGEYERGIPLAQQSCNLAKTYFGANHPSYATSLNNLAALYCAMGRLAEAEPLYLQAKEIWRVGLGENHPSYAASLNNLAGLYRAMGRFAEAELLYLQAQEIRRVSLGGNHPDYAASLNNLAGLYYAMGRFAEAEPLYLQAKEIRRVRLGENHPDYAASLNDLAALYRAMGRLAEAEPLYLQAKEIWRVGLGENHPSYAASLNNLAALYESMGRLADAEPLYLQAKEIRRDRLGENHPDYAASLNNLAGLYRAMGRFADAEPLYLQAKEIWRVALGENHPSYAASLNNLAGLYRAMGRFAEAEPLYLQVKEIIRVSLGGNHPDYAKTLNNLAGLYRAMGRFAEAEPLYLQVKEIRRVRLGENHPDYATSLNDLAELYHAMGRFADAEPLYLQAKEIRRVALGENHPDYATSLNNLAGLYRAMGRFADAEPLYLQAKEIRRVALGENHPDYATSLNNLAVLYESMGRFADAEPLYVQAKEIRRVALGENHPDYATSLNNLAGLYKSVGRFADAEPLYVRAKEIRRVALGENHPDYAASLNNLALLLAATDRPQEALRLMREAAKIQTQILGQIFSISSDTQRLNYMQQNYYQVEIFLSLVAQYLPDDSEAVLAAFELIMQRKALATEAAIQQRLLILSERHRHLAPQLEHLRQLDHQIAYQTLNVPPAEQLPAYQNRLKELQEQRDELDRQISRQIPEMNLQKQLDNASRDAIAKALPKGAALVEFVRFNVWNFKAVKANGDSQWQPAHYLAFILSASQPDEVRMIDLGEAEPTDELIRELRKSVSGERDLDLGLDTPASEPAPTPSVNTPPIASLQLYQKLIAPLKPHLQPQQQVFLAPDGELTCLPFGVLSANGLQYLMEEYALSYLSVGRDVLRFNFPIPAQPTAPLVIANPDFNLASPEIPQPPQPQSPGKQPQPIDKNLFIAVLTAFMVIASIVILVAVPAFGVCLLAAGLIWLAFYVQKASYPERLREFEDKARSADRIITQSQPNSTPSNSPQQPETREGGFRLYSREFHSPGSIHSSHPDTPDIKELRRELTRGKSKGFKPIPGTGIEGARIAQLLNVPAHTDAKALKSLVSRCVSPTILHIATHGFFQESLPQKPADTFEIGKIGRVQHAPQHNPMTRSGLAFAGANTVLKGGIIPPEAEDALLTAQGAAGLQLPATELVVMSACLTGLGDRRVGEGVLGLRRAFVLAGAKTLVMSLWSVPDISTAILMERFYHNLFDYNMGRAKALEEAQYYLRDLTVGQIRDKWLTPEAIAWVRQRSDVIANRLQELSQESDECRPYTEPKYWAAFICQGNPDPLPVVGGLG
ncbi:CHAT domain-containing protein [Kamptonema formosum]|uniref:CHAT domain-containing protein n=1 Tax=Kamptonema formosum TaxID=331992 RepID=UPI0003659E07|nr:CHAT domain-containing tetratricopeptide repeat protein [Oscillatoria sp. PCC 10802]